MWIISFTIWINCCKFKCNVFQFVSCCCWIFDVYVHQISFAIRHPVFISSIRVDYLVNSYRTDKHRMSNYWGRHRWIISALPYNITETSLSTERTNCDASTLVQCHYKIRLDRLMYLKVLCKIVQHFDVERLLLTAGASSKSTVILSFSDCSLSFQTSVIGEVSSLRALPNWLQWRKNGNPGVYGQKFIDFFYAWQQEVL